MDNPLRNIKLKIWPDYLMSISGAAYVTSLVAMYAGNELAKSLSIMFFGMVLFGIGGKISHYSFRDKNIVGNTNAWFSGWRHSILGNSFAIVGLLSIIVGIWLLVSEKCLTIA